MDIIQQIAVEMVGKISEIIRKDGLRDIGKLTKELKPAVDHMVLSVVKTCLDEMDSALVNGAKALRRKDGITIKERAVERTLLTDLGEITYKRTYFRMKDGSFVYLLDHLIGVESYERISRELVSELLDIATVKSYQHAIRTLGQPLSRQTVHNRLVALNDLTVDVEREETTPPVLDIFADEDHVHLNPKGCAIVPLVTISDGMDETNSKRHRTINPVHIAAYGMEQAAFNENVLAVLTKRYNFDEVKTVNIHADGGRWIQGLQQLIPKSRMIMDGFHLEKHLKTFLHLEGASVYASAIRNDLKNPNGYASFAKHCSLIFDKQTTDVGRKKVNEFKNYCAAFWDTIVLRMNKAACGSCTEPLVSHVLSDRLSRNPIAWSKTGLRKMTMLVVYEKNGKKVRSSDIRTRPDAEAETSFYEDGYAKYWQYAKEQADGMLKGRHDWSIFEHFDPDLGKVDGAFLIRKSLGSMESLIHKVS